MYLSRLCRQTFRKYKKVPKLVPKHKALPYQVQRTSSIYLVHPGEHHVKNRKELTIYIKGFMSKGETQEKFENWLDSHNKVVEKKGWGEVAKGWHWKSGEGIGFPLPIATALMLLSKTRFLRLSPMTLAAAGVTDLAVVATDLLQQYYVAEKNSVEHAHLLQMDITRLNEKYEKVRIVAHSLGCQLLLNALRDMPQGDKPYEIHLCAPAFEEKPYEDILGYLAKDHTYIYYCEDDLILGAGMGVFFGKGSGRISGLKKILSQIKMC